MMTPGIVSVTFRNLDIFEIIALAAENGLKAVETGGDVHLLPGDAEKAAKIREAAEKAGVKPLSYGSYYRCLGNEEEEKTLIATAKALGAGNIRVWAGDAGSVDQFGYAKPLGDASQAVYRGRVVETARRLCDSAAVEGMTVSFEWHMGTLTDTCASAVSVAEDIGRPNLRLYWQPNQFRDFETNLSELKTALPYVSTVHVFSWKGRDMFPLADQTKEWKAYIGVLAADGRDHDLLMEFVPHGEKDELVRDAAVLNGWIRELA